MIFLVVLLAFASLAACGLVAALIAERRELRQLTAAIDRATTALDVAVISGLIKELEEL